jgi:hypothetical protein
MFFQNRDNGYIEQVTMPRLSTLLFGPLYFASRGVWTHCVASLLLALCTGGVSWLLYPLAAAQIMETHYTAARLGADQPGPTCARADALAPAGSL